MHLIPIVFVSVYRSFIYYTQIIAGTLKIFSLVKKHGKSFTPVLYDRMHRGYQDPQRS